MHTISNALFEHVKPHAYGRHGGHHQHWSSLMIARRFRSGYTPTTTATDASSEPRRACHGCHHIIGRNVRLTDRARRRTSTLRLLLSDSGDISGNRPCERKQLALMDDARVEALVEVDLE